jgi:hypothetical protein
LLIGAASAVSLFGVAAVAAPAMAGTGPASVTAVTHVSNHPDTTGLPPQYLPGATLSSPGGPVWAYDNLSERFAVTDLGDSHYTVNVTLQGSFQGFADPRTPQEEADLGLLHVPGTALDSQGSVKGTISYDVYSPEGGPDPAALPSQEPSDTHLSDEIHHLFPGADSTEIIGGGNHYTFTYTKVNGQVYQQRA